MVSNSQTKVAQGSKAQSKDLPVSRAQSKSLPVSGAQSMDLPVQIKPSKKMRFTSTAENDPNSTTSFDEEPKSARGITTMSRVVKRNMHKVKPVVEYNRRGKPHGKAATEMQSYIGVLARTRVPLVDTNFKKLPKDIRERLWETVDKAYAVGQGGKKMVLSSAAKKWTDFKTSLTRKFILPYKNNKERLSRPPQLYEFIEQSQWEAFVASRLSPAFEVVHKEQKERREKCEYNHRLSRKGYVGLEDQLEETMPIEEIDRSLLWRKAREDKQGNIPDPKVAEKAKKIVSLYHSVLNFKNRAF